MTEFWRLFRESTIIQGLVTVMFTSVVCYAIVTQIDLGEQFWAMFGIIVGFWFGNKTNQQVREVIQALNQSQITKL